MNNAALDVAHDAAYDAALDAVRDAACDPAFDVALDVAHDAACDAADDADHDVPSVDVASTQRHNARVTRGHVERSDHVLPEHKIRFLRQMRHVLRHPKAHDLDRAYKQLIE